VWRFRVYNFFIDSSDFVREPKWLIIKRWQLLVGLVVSVACAASSQLFSEFSQEELTLLVPTGDGEGRMVEGGAREATSTNHYTQIPKYIAIS
jgi:hypothetical protein